MPNCSIFDAHVRLTRLLNNEDHARQQLVVWQDVSKFFDSDQLRVIAVRHLDAPHLLAFWKLSIHLVRGTL